MTSSDFSEIFGETSPELIPAIIGLYVVVLALVLIFALVFFIFSAIGYYGAAKTAGLKYPWLAFIPVANSFIIGRLAETPTEPKKPLRYGIILPVFAIAGAVIGALTLFLTMGAVAGAVANGADLSTESGTAIMISSLLSVMTLSSLCSLVSLARSVFYYIALYRIFKIFVPENAVLYILLSILLSVTEPFLVFTLRKKPLTGYAAQVKQTPNTYYDQTNA